MWSRDGRELYYREGDWSMFVKVQLDPVSVSRPQRLFELSGNAYNLDQNFADYDVAPDGRFFAIRNEDSEQPQAYVVVNWIEELKQRVPTK